MVSRNRKIARRIGQAVANDVLDISGAISAGAGVTVYATADDLPTTGLTAGDEAFVSGSNRLYISNGTGWYSIGLVNTNPAITSVEDPSSNTTPFTLATDGSALVLTITAADPEDVPLTYSYAVTTGSLTNGGGTTATVVQGTGANTNQFTITPTTTEAYAGTFDLTFTTSDGINQASSVNSFTLNFITTIANSNYTTLLATATAPNSTVYRYFKFLPQEMRSASPDAMQYSEFELTDGTSYYSPSSASQLYRADNTDGDDYSANQNVAASIDGNTSTKLYNGGWASKYYLYDMGSSFNTVLTGWRYKTGNDMDSRDPVSWTLLGSTNNTDWVLLDQRVNETITTSRLTATQDFTFNATSQAFFNAANTNYPIEVNGDTHAGTFSPYRSGGYSTYFGNGGSERITVEGTKSTLAGANADFSVSAWIYPTAGTDKWIYGTNISNNNQAGWHDLYLEGSTKLVWRHSDGSTHRSMISTNPVSLNEWSYVLINRTSSVTYMYINGSLVAQNSDMTNALYTHTNAPSIGIRHFYDNGTTGLDFEGYITDVHVKTAAISSPTTIPTERAVADSDTWLLTAHLPYFTDGSSNNYTVGAYNNVSTKPFSPYDYLEYLATDHGGCVFIEANGGHLSGTLSSGGLGTTFTVEMWIYDDGTGGDTTYGGYFTTTDISSQYGIQLRRYGAYIFNSTTGTNLTWNANGHPFATVFGIGWHHVAAVHNGSTFKVYVDGKEVISRSDSHTYSSVNYKVGQPWLYQSDATLQAKAYISDLRINKSVIYSGEFTPPTAPLSSSGAELHIKGTDASIIDKSQGFNLKLYGGTAGSTTTNFTGAKSIYIDGPNGDYISLPASDNYKLGTGDFTLETWVKVLLVSNDAGRRRIFNQVDTTSSTAGQLELMVYPDGYFYVRSGSNIFATTTDFSDGSWYHLALVRHNSVLKVYVDGSLENSANNTTDFSPSAISPIIGRASSTAANSRFQGYIQDFRITKGLARYTANFTPPTASLEG